MAQIPEEKIRCQSCGMPIDESFGNLGTMNDGSFHNEYCNICFKNGSFTNPTQTMEEMIVSSIDNMVNEIGMPKSQASQLANDFIPTLGRWK